MNLPQTSTHLTTGKRAAERKKAGPPAWKIRRKPRFISYKALILPSNGKGIYGKSLWILGSKKPANPHEYWQKWGRHLKCLPQMVGEDGFEPSKLKAADLQSVPFGHSGTLPYKVVTFALLHMALQRWSWWTDLNPRPADYKSAALPTELHQHLYQLFSSA